MGIKDKLRSVKKDPKAKETEIIAKPVELTEAELKEVTGGASGTVAETKIRLADTMP